MFSFHCIPYQSCVSIACGSQVRLIGLWGLSAPAAFTFLTEYFVYATIWIRIEVSRRPPGVGTSSVVCYLIVLSMIAVTITTLIRRKMTISIVTTSLFSFIRFRLGSGLLLTAFSLSYNHIIVYVYTYINSNTKQIYVYTFVNFVCVHIVDFMLYFLCKVEKVTVFFKP